MAFVDAPPETPLVLDTDIFSHLRNDQKYVQEHINAHFRQTRQFPALTAITVFEARIGTEREIVQNSLTEHDAGIYQQRIHNLIQTHKILPFEQRAAEIAACVYPRIPRKELRKEKGKEKTFWKDIFIVSIAIARNYGLATRNKRDMELIANYLPNNLDLRLAVWKP